jgi:hypothetical protein
MMQMFNPTAVQLEFTTKIREEIWTVSSQFKEALNYMNTANQGSAPPPSLETILKRADEVKRRAVKGRPHRELEALWAKDRQKATGSA